MKGKRYIWLLIILCIVTANIIYNIKRPSIKHTLKLADKKWCKYALSHSINPDDYVCDKIKYDENNYIFVYKNVNNINTSTYDIMLKRNHYVFKKETYVNYYPNGNIKEIYHKKNGELTDKYTMFHENGRIAIVGYYENDEKTGEWKEYDIMENCIKITSHEED